MRVDSLLSAFLRILLDYIPTSELQSINQSNFIYAPAIIQARSSLKASKLVWEQKVSFAPAPTAR